MNACFMAKAVEVHATPLHLVVPVGLTMADPEHGNDTLYQGSWANLCNVPSMVIHRPSLFMLSACSCGHATLALCKDICL